MNKLPLTLIYFWRSTISSQCKSLQTVHDQLQQASLPWRVTLTYLHDSTNRKRDLRCIPCMQVRQQGHSWANAITGAPSEWFYFSPFHLLRVTCKVEWIAESSSAMTPQLKWNLGSNALQEAMVISSKWTNHTGILQLTALWHQDCGSAEPLSLD